MHYVIAPTKMVFYDYLMLHNLTEKNARWCHTKEHLHGLPRDSTVVRVLTNKWNVDRLVADVLLLAYERFDNLQTVEI